MATEGAYALEFTFDSPDEVNVNEEFSIVIHADTQDNYDVKAFVYVIDKNSYVSQIYSGGQWKNPSRYIKNAYPSQTSFQIKALQEIESEICVRMRRSNTNSSTYSEQCRAIRIIDEGGNQQNTNSNNNQNDEDEEQEENNIGEENSSQVSGNFTNDRVLANINSNEPPQKIVLNNAKIEDKKRLNETTNEYKVRMGVIYSFVALCVILIALLAWKKL